MRIKVTSGARLAADRADDELEQLADRMLDLTEQGAAYLRDTDPYQNRTGNLRKSTRARLEQDGDPVVVVLEMDQDYASYVKRLGYSNFDDAVATVRDEVRRGIAAMGTRIVGR